MRPTQERPYQVPLAPVNIFLLPWTKFLPLVFIMQDMGQPRNSAGGPLDGGRRAVVERGSPWGRAAPGFVGSVDTPPCRTVIAPTVRCGGETSLGQGMAQTTTAQRISELVTLAVRHLDAYSGNVRTRHHYASFREAKRELYALRPDLAPGLLKFVLSQTHWGVAGPSGWEQLQLQRLRERRKRAGLA